MVSGEFVLCSRGARGDGITGSLARHALLLSACGLTPPGIIYDRTVIIIRP